MHRKHAAIARPTLGNFGRNELSIVGAPCGDVQALAGQVITALRDEFNIAYLDAQHSDDAETASANPVQGAAIVSTTKAGKQELLFEGELSSFEHRRVFNGADLVLVNGNHYTVKQQIVIINSKKKDSLKKRLAELTAIQLFVLADGEAEIFDFLKESIADWQQIPVLKIDDLAGIINLIQKQLLNARPVINGLVLTGGKSQRMGTDKGSVNWHGKPQLYYAADLLKNFCKDVYISCRADQQADVDSAYHTLPDTFLELGPYGAILSAFRQQPDSAWLVVACDLPLLDQATLQQLVTARKAKHIATAFKSPHDDFPEPLITIWEPKSYQELLSFMAQGYSCPRKMLINSDAHIINANNPNALTNVNTPEELQRVQDIIRQRIE